MMVLSGWVSYEVVQKDSDGNHAICPFSVALATSGTIQAQPLRKMSMVQEIGWPEAKRRLKDDQGRSLIVKKDEVIWLLKCKPTCWRLYFYVWEESEDKRIIYVHAVCKKADREYPGDVAEAKRIADEIRRGESCISKFEFPPG